METEKNFRKYGDRTSSLISLYPHFASYRDSGNVGEIRYCEKSNVVGIANEPLAPENKKLNLIFNFFTKLEFQKKDKLIFPITSHLATTLKENGYFVWQIGVEPIFNLDEYFNSTIDPLQNLPIAKSLSRRGVKIEEITEDEIINLREEITELKEEWLSQKKMAPLEFLNVIDPLSHEEYKRFFILKDRNIITAILTASPIYLNEQIVGYFFNDILKRKQARSASSELLIIESMRKLFHEGIIEVRLGMCPLAEINPNEKNANELNSIFNKWKIGYNFKNLYNFKKKLSPTKMRPLYLASDRPEFTRMLKNVFKLHVSTGFFQNLLLRNWYAYKQNLKLKEHIKTKTVLIKNKSLSLLSRTKVTLSLFTFFISMHALKNMTAFGENLYNSSAYIPSKVSPLGLFIGPILHNHALHLIGDQLSFLVFAGILEYTFGITFMLMTTAIGLWLSNPVTHLILASTLKFISNFWWEQVLSEKDYGTSNAVFALVGASLYVLKKNMWLFIPFFFHALFVCFQRESFLAIHHLVGIFLGYSFALIHFSNNNSQRVK
jgi:hypothetical protein